MSMNPARSFASAAVANVWTGWWIYMMAPVLAMFLAAEVFVRTRGLKAVLCAKLNHSGQARCIFNCNFDHRGAIEVTKQPQIFPGMSGSF